MTTTPLSPAATAARPTRTVGDTLGLALLSYLQIPVCRVFLRVPPLSNHSDARSCCRLASFQPATRTVRRFLLAGSCVPGSAVCMFRRVTARAIVDWPSFEIVRLLIGGSLQASVSFQGLRTGSSRICLRRWRSARRWPAPPRLSAGAPKTPASVDRSGRSANPIRKDLVRTNADGSLIQYGRFSIRTTRADKCLQ
jgi:hypothetical protein